MSVRDCIVAEKHLADEPRSCKGANGLQALDELPSGSGSGPAAGEVARLRGGAGPAATRAARRQQQVFAVNDNVEVTLL